MLRLVLDKMGKTKLCSYCGKKSTIIYICPECGNTYCYEHKSIDSHNCLKKEVNKEITNEKIEQKNPDVEEFFETTPDIEFSTYKDQEYLSLIPEFIFKDEENIDLKQKITKEDETYEIKGGEIEFAEQVQEIATQKQEVPLKKTDDNSKPKLKNDIKEKSSEGKYIKHIFSIKKMLFAGIFIILLSIGYLYLNGSFSIIPLISNQQETSDKDYYENYTLIRSKYDELNNKYKKLGSDYYELESEYKELIILYNSSREYKTEQILENMIQITIPADSNTIFYYEIPFPGYINVEYYSDTEIYAMVGSSKLDTVYYSRQPQQAKSSEYAFSIPVLPEINLMFVNPDRNQEATMFLKVTYYCN